MSNAIRPLERVTDSVSLACDGLRTLAALLAHVGDHHDFPQRRDEFAHGLSALIGAVADQCQETLETLCMVDAEVTTMAQRTAHLEAEQHRRESMPMGTREGMAAHVAIVFGPHLSTDSREPSAAAPQ